MPCSSVHLGWRASMMGRRYSGRSFRPGLVRRRSSQCGRRTSWQPRFILRSPTTCGSTVISSNWSEPPGDEGSENLRPRLGLVRLLTALGCFGRFSTRLGWGVRGTCWPLLGTLRFEYGFGGVGLVCCRGDRGLGLWRAWRLRGTLHGGLRNRLALFPRGTLGTPDGILGRGWRLLI